MITVEQYLEHGRSIDTPSDDVLANAEVIVARANDMLSRAAAAGIECAVEPRLNSGWRPAAYNATVAGASATSKHMSGQAIDIGDPDGMLDDWCVRNLEVLAELGLWLEHPASTKGWTHVQCVAPRSGNRIFYP